MMKKASKGFTLIELMIVVAIIGILAAIAIPNFLRYQLRSRASERNLNLEAIFKSEEALRQLERPNAPSGYGAVALVPASNVNPTNQKVPWLATDLAIAQGIDWIVQGSTYGAYMAAVSGNAQAMSACAVTDIDADDQNAVTALWNPQLAPAGTVQTAPPDAPCALVTGGANDTTVKSVAYVHGNALSPMGRPAALSAESRF